MSASKPALYEGMFLFNSALIQSSVSAASDVLRQVLDRAEAEIVSMYKWDERKLAYPIKGQKRGLYMLVYFNARGTQIPNIERDVNLSDEILRCMILRGDHIGEAELQEAEEKARETQAAAALAGEAGEGEGEGGAGEAAAGTSETAEAGRSESEAAPGAEKEAERPTPEGGEGGEAEKAPEAGTRSE